MHRGFVVGILRPSAEPRFSANFQRLAVRTRSAEGPREGLRGTRDKRNIQPGLSNASQTCATASSVGIEWLRQNRDQADTSDQHMTVH
jgi:hypothetical protein